MQHIPVKLNAVHIHTISPSYISAFNAETQQTASRQLDPCTPLHQQAKHPAPTFTSAEVRRYKQQQEEGYDLPDPRYLLWLENVGGSPATVATGHGDTVNSSCQRGECDHLKARLWIVCDQGSSWYHCLCVGVRHKKAETVDFMCYTCIHHSYTAHNMFSTCSRVLPSPHCHFSDFQCIHLLMTPTFNVLRSHARLSQGIFARNLDYEQNISAPK